MKSIKKIGTTLAGRQKSDMFFSWVLDGMQAIVLIVLGSGMFSVITNPGGLLLTF